MAKKENKKSSKGNFKLIKTFLKGSKRFFIPAILFAVLVCLTELINPKIIAAAVDSVIGENAPDGFIAEQVVDFYNRTGLYAVAALIVVIALVAVLFRYSFRMLNSLGAETLVETMRNTLFGHIEHLPFSWHTKNNTGDTIQRCTSDIDMIKRFLSEQFINVLRISIQIVLSIIFMLSVSPKLTIISGVSIPVILTYSVFFRKKIGRDFKTCDENEGKLSAIAQENLTGVRVVRAFGRERHERDKFSKQNEYYTGLWTRLMRFMASFWALNDLISGLVVLCILVYGSYLCIYEGLTPGKFIAFISYNAMLIFPVRMLGRMITEMSKAGISLDRLAEIMDSPTEDTSGITEGVNPYGDIVFDNVSFSYNGEKKILDGVSFTVKGGSTVGILGGTGSGKSTLMQLLCRMYDTEDGNGKITLDGTDIKDIGIEYLRKNIGIVLQETFLFSRSIAENIGISEENPDIDEIRRAAGIACFDETVMSFSQGYDTFVGERGVTLSGGQKQRCAIARMLMEKTPVRIFDDSLSAVDAETDAKIRASLKESGENGTVFLVSHRITTLMHSDLIVVLEAGRVAECGTHDELLEKNGIYRRIYDIQFAGIKEESK